MLFDQTIGAYSIIFAGVLVMVLARLGVLDSDDETAGTLALTAPGPVLPPAATKPLKPSKPICHGRLEIFQSTRSVRITPGVGATLFLVFVKNSQAKYPNNCNGVKAELTFTFTHTGEVIKLGGLFIATDTQSTLSEPFPSLSLAMLTETTLALFVRSENTNDFRTFTQWPFDALTEHRLEFGEWTLKIRVTSDSNEDWATDEFLLQLNPDMSSSWTRQVIRG